MSQHGATASRALEDHELVEAVFEDPATAPIGDGLRATLGLIEKLMERPGELTATDVEAVRAAGVSDDAIDDAVHVGAIFVIFNKLADAMGWDMLPPEVYDKRAQIALERGYVVPDEALE